MCREDAEPSNDGGAAAVWAFRATFTLRRQQQLFKFLPAGLTDVFKKRHARTTFRPAMGKHQERHPVKSVRYSLCNASVPALAAWAMPLAPHEHCSRAVAHAAVSFRTPFLCWRPTPTVTRRSLAPHTRRNPASMPQNDNEYRAFCRALQCIGFKVSAWRKVELSALGYVERGVFPTCCCVSDAPSAWWPPWPVTA